MYSQVMMAEKAIIHEDWKGHRSQRSANNIALLKLPSRSKYTAPKVLADHFKMGTGQKLMAIGWGTSGGGPNLGDDIFGSLKMEPQEFIYGSHCNRTNLWNGSVPPNLDCGLNAEHRASCVGQFTSTPATAPVVL